MRTTDAPVLSSPADLRLANGVERLGFLLQAGEIEEARLLTSELAAGWPENPRVQHYLRVLAPPVATPVPRQRPRGFRAERAWLRDHAHEHPGCWLAVLGDKLLAEDPAIGAVLAALRQHPTGGGALLHYEPADVE